MNTSPHVYEQRGHPPRRRHIVADLAEVSVWTSGEGHWQEHAWFLLRDHSGHRRSVGFAEPEASELVIRLCALPDFDADALRDLVLCEGRGCRSVTLWSAR
ncbi:MAG TPA: hypothetical protein VGH99_17245 [Pseudonocardia sp.]|jgi:hypothetical protein